jgi:hypothetical protein
MTKLQYTNATGIFSTQLAIGSFIIGTILVLLNPLFPSGELLVFGLIYVLVATFFNSIMLFNLIYLLMSQKNHREYFLIKILILIANIPIAFLYLNIIF